MSKAEDIALVSQVILFGSERAYRRLVEKYQVAIRRFFLSHTCGNKATSDDLAQETFIKVWTNIASFRGLASFSTWLYAIAYRVLCDYYRSGHETEQLDKVQADGMYAYEQPDLAAAYDLSEALKRLKQEERICILFFYREDLTIAKISVITGMPEGTVKSHLSRAKSKLTKFLNQQGYAYGKRSGTTATLSEREFCKAL